MSSEEDPELALESTKVKVGACLLRCNVSLAVSFPCFKVFIAEVFAAQSSPMLKSFKRNSLNWSIVFVCLSCSVCKVFASAFDQVRESSWDEPEI